MKKFNFRSKATKTVSKRNKKGAKAFKLLLASSILATSLATASTATFAGAEDLDFPSESIGGGDDGNDINDGTDINLGDGYEEGNIINNNEPNGDDGDSGDSGDDGDNIEGPNNTSDRISIDGNQITIVEGVLRNELHSFLSNYIESNYSFGHQLVGSTIASNGVPLDLGDFDVIEGENLIVALVIRNNITSDMTYINFSITLSSGVQDGDNQDGDNGQQPPTVEPGSITVDGGTITIKEGVTYAQLISFMTSHVESDLPPLTHLESVDLASGDGSHFGFNPNDVIDVDNLNLLVTLYDGYALDFNTVVYNVVILDEESDDDDQYSMYYIDGSVIRVYEGTSIQALLSDTDFQKEFVALVPRGYTTLGAYFFKKGYSGPESNYRTIIENGDVAKFATVSLYDYHFINFVFEVDSRTDNGSNKGNNRPSSGPLVWAPFDFGNIVKKFHNINNSVANESNPTKTVFGEVYEKTNSWADESIELMVQVGLLEGLERKKDLLKNPDTSLTGDELTKVLVNLVSLLTNESGAKALEELKHKGVLKENSKSSEVITRAEMVVIISSLLKNFYGVEAPKNEETNIKFKDVDKDASYLSDLQMLVDIGIIKGTSDNTFDPNGSLTLAQLASILDRFNNIQY